MTKEIAIKNEVSPVVAKAQELKIETKMDLEVGVSMLSQCNKILDKVTEEKEKLTKPLNATLKEIRSRYKPMEDMLTEAVKTIKGKMSVYQTQAMKEQAEAEAKIANDVIEGNTDVGDAMEKLGELDSPDKKVVVDEGSVGFRAKKCFEVVEISKVPVEYLLPNEPMIRKAMNEGLQLDGIRYFEEQIIVNKR